MNQANPRRKALPLRLQQADLVGNARPIPRICRIRAERHPGGGRQTMQGNLPPEEWGVRTER